MASILVIDDDHLVRDTLSIMLTEAGHTVVTAKDGIEGVKKALRGGFDVAVIDIFMPEREGLETIRELRRRPGTPAIVAITGGTPLQIHRPQDRVLDYLQVAADLGAAATIRKPFTQAQLLAAVDKALASAAAYPLYREAGEGRGEGA
ncbi:MAG TPA: response regulator [Methylomirabilota bacterium]|nr:response regulator [Methylomirabilota bacterium]